MVAALSGGGGRIGALRARRGRRAPASCGGAADPSLHASRVITGEFDTSLEGGYVMLPFTCPAGTTAVRVRYCHDQPEAPTNARIKHVLDLGLWTHARRRARRGRSRSSAAGAGRAIPT